VVCEGVLACGVVGGMLRGCGVSYNVREVWCVGDLCSVVDKVC